jgi:hypothetical protein
MLKNLLLTIGICLLITTPVLASDEDPSDRGGAPTIRFEEWFHGVRQLVAEDQTKPLAPLGGDVATLIAKQLDISSAKRFSLVCKAFANATDQRHHLKIDRSVNNEQLIYIMKTKRHITSLDISECHSISPETLIYVAGLYPGLTSLNIGQCGQITSEALIQVASMCPNLTSLDIKFCRQIAPEALIQVARSCPGLTYLNMTHSKITPEALVQVARSCPGLTHLNVDICRKITPEALIQVARLCQFSEVI